MSDQRGSRLHSDRSEQPGDGDPPEDDEVGGRGTCRAPEVALGRRMVSFVAAVSLLVGLSASWLSVSVLAQAAGLGIMVGFAVALAGVFGALLIRRDAMLARWDVGLLVAAGLTFALEHVAMVLPGYNIGNDETYLGHDALVALLAGRNPYTLHFPDILAHTGLTPLLNGDVVTAYEYPPLTVELGWALGHLWRPLGEPYVVAALALIALTAVSFFALPTSWRVLSLPLILGFGLATTYAALGYPTVVALPLLAVAISHWTSIGEGGRLGARGLGQAAALGGAAATHQLAWIVAILLVVSLWVVRRGELRRREAAATIGRFVAVAVVVFLVLNAPFLLSDAAGRHAWLRAMTSVFTQHAVPFGVGLVMITVAAVGHSGALHLYTYATVLLAGAIVTIIAVGLRRVALAVPVFMGVLFLLSTRSTADYVIIFAPLWLVWAGTTDAAAIEASRPVRWARKPVLTTSARRAAAVVAVLVPALGLALVAVLTPAPLRIQARTAVLTRGELVRVTFTVTNTTGHTVRPSWFINQRTHLAGGWTIVRGPRVLSAGRQATLTAVPNGGPVTVAPYLTVYALSDSPAALSSTRLQLGLRQVVLTSPNPGPVAQARQQCAIRLLAGAAAC